MTHHLNKNLHSEKWDQAPLSIIRKAFALQMWFWKGCNSLPNEYMYIQNPSVVSEHRGLPLTWYSLSESSREGPTADPLSFIDLTKAFDLVSKKGLFR